MKNINKKILAIIAFILSAVLGNLNADILDVEKDTLKFGFIKLTDCAPIVIAKEKGYFDDEGLSVEVEAQGNWKELLNRVINGDLDGAHMLAGQPIGATVGFGTKADVLTAYSLDYNGNGITVSNDIWKQMKPNVKKDATGKVIHPITADSLKPIADEASNNNAKLKMGMVFPVSTHNYEIRYWLAASNISPGFYYDPSTKQRDIAGFLNSDVELSVTPPPQMPQTLEAGTICAYCVGEPWNQQAVFKKIGVPVTTNYDIWKNNPEKVFGVSAEWAKKNPNTWIAVTKALIRAGHWLDASWKNRDEAAKILSQPNYVGAPYKVIKNSMTGTFEFEPGVDVREMKDFNVFFRYNASYPYYSDAVWFLTQMVRWGQITEQKEDSWYHTMAKKIYRPDVYMKAVDELIDDGLFEESVFLPAVKANRAGGYKPATSDFIDGKTYDGKKPNDYIDSFKIGLK
ncbi:MAG: CmpA/NrtA family ABC transporter substrate-binding protein [Verrucomicrobiota bacterium]|jgi:nitrate/nitrite transport system substrate-binding protein|nr:nitrate ABC transporter substrate-binding protein [Alphaproteobacteria bacterium]MEC9043752.1 CmpA/NrtA family ABC transporter substrate-binding protein [Verrucomicrobiota bacterium]MED5457291.1 CmpA/NrtA family ABC transporter substrate-binding protein [Verrucomicrobiota bacterium]MEE2724969.1 CmpA/NrtA family ABC transporter substrate-binding protein [Verrucomicrobiota bacterium]